MGKQLPQPQNTPLRWSFGLFVFALVIFIITGVFLDSVLASVSDTIQRVVTFVLIILPTLAGVVFGFVTFSRLPSRQALMEENDLELRRAALNRRSLHIFLSVLAILLNGLTALFFTFLINFAG